MGLQLGATYTIIGADGTRVVFNDTSDPDFVGRLDPEEGISGLDSPEIRQSMDNIVEGDGAVQGLNYFGARPFTMQGIIEPAGTVETNGRIDKLERCINRCLRADGLMRWTEDGSSERQLSFRTQQPTRIKGRRPKTFFLGLVSADAPIKSSALQSQIIPAIGTAILPGFSFPLTFPLTFGTGGSGLGSAAIVNLGTYETTPSFRLDGPITNPIIANNTTSEELRLIIDLLAGQWMDINSADHTITFGGTTDRYATLDFANSKWWDLEPGSNNVVLRGSAYASPAALTVYWRHAYI